MSDDIRPELAAVQARLSRTLDDVRKDAMIDIGFNLGATRLRGFKRALGAMERGEYKEAATEFLDSRWAKQVGGRALELTDLIKTGEYVE